MCCAIALRMCETGTISSAPPARRPARPAHRGGAAALPAAGCAAGAGAVARRRPAPGPPRRHEPQHVVLRDPPARPGPAHLREVDAVLRRQLPNERRQDLRPRPRSAGGATVCVERQPALAADGGSRRGRGWCRGGGGIGATGGRRRGLGFRGAVRSELRRSCPRPRHQPAPSVGDLARAPCRPRPSRPPPPGSSSRVTPAADDGTSVSTLSVEISNSGSSSATWSPSCLSHFRIVPSIDGLAELRHLDDGHPASRFTTRTACGRRPRCRTPAAGTRPRAGGERHRDVRRREPHRPARPATRTPPRRSATRPRRPSRGSAGLVEHDRAARLRHAAEDRLLVERLDGAKVDAPRPGCPRPPGSRRPRAPGAPSSP